jgi:hypothetical protein
MTRLILSVFLLLPAFAQAFDLNGIALGAREADIKRGLPSAYCRPIDWNSPAADRRCDDAKVIVGGVVVKAALYLKADALQAFELRFDVNNREKVLAHLKARWGAPLSEATETFVRRKGGERRVLKVRWVKGAEQAMLTAELDRPRASISAWRGDFREEIYRVR